MAYQIYRIREWERVGGVDGYSTIRAYLQPRLYETEAYARKKAARLADQDYESGTGVRGRGPRNAYFRRSGTEGLPCTVRRRSDGFLKKIRSAWHPEKHRTPIPRYLAKPCYYGLLLFARNISESAHKS